jgi:hypothetical protein
LTRSARSFYSFAVRRFGIATKRPTDRSDGAAFCHAF